MRAPSCVVSVKSGAGPILDRRATDFTLTTQDGARMKSGAGPILDRRASGFGAWPTPGAGQAPSPMRRLAITDARVGPFRLRLPSRQV